MHMSDCKKMLKILKIFYSVPHNKTHASWDLKETTWEQLHTRWRTLCFATYCTRSGSLLCATMRWSQWTKKTPKCIQGESNGQKNLLQMLYNCQTIFTSNINHLENAWKFFHSLYPAISNPLECLYFEDKKIPSMAEMANREGPGFLDWPGEYNKTISSFTDC